MKNAPKPVEWSAEGLQEQIIKFIVETDQVSLNLHLTLQVPTLMRTRQSLSQIMKCSASF